MITNVAPASGLSEGWVLFDPNPHSKWHYRLADGVIKCMPNRLYHVQPIEWRAEPRGRHEACPACRRFADQQELERKSLARSQAKLAATPVPDAEPETLVADEPIPFVINTVKEEPVKAEPVPSSSGMHSVASFAKEQGIYAQLLRDFVEERLPDVPTYGSGKRTVLLLDRAAQKKVLADFPEWRKQRDEETKNKNRAALVKARAVRAAMPPEERKTSRDATGLEAKIDRLTEMMEAILRELRVKV